MPRRDPASLPPLDAWRTQSLRFTAFPVIGSKVDHHAWWAETVGSPPDTIQSQPKTGITTETGKLNEAALTLQIQPERVDWILAAPDDQDKVMPDIGPLPETANVFFSGIVRRWLGLIPPVLRLAVGAELLMPVPNRETGYRHLADYLDDVRVDPATRDFLYQVNKRRSTSTGIPGLEINRLMTWSVAQFRSIVFAVRDGSTRTTAAPVTFACRLALDMNTAQDFQGEIPNDRVALVVDELVRCALEITKAGDIA